MPAKAARKPEKPRPRNAAATREAILKSARKAFSAHGYDGAGVREIAAEAGVTAMLVNRYFGSKEQLFIEVIDETLSGATIITPNMPPAPELGDYLASGVLATTRPDTTPLDGTMMMLRSATSGSPRLAEIGRRQIEKFHLKNLTAALKGADAAERAALILALTSGVQFMRQMVGLTALTKSSPAALQKLLASVIQQLVDGTPRR